MSNLKVEDATRYKIYIDGVAYYVIVSETAISVHYAFENREENIETRKILEKFCAGVSQLMEDYAGVRTAMANVAIAGGQR